MKIYVCKELFSGDMGKFKTPMEMACGVLVDETLKLGEMIIEDDDGVKTLVVMEPPTE